MNAPKTSTELLSYFGTFEERGYTNPTQLKDTEVGFSIQKKYPSDIRFKPAVSKSGEDDNVAVIWVVYERGKKKVSDDHVPIRLRIAMMSRYRAAHWDYDFSADECPTEDSIKLSRNTPRPLDINITDFYFYSENRKTIIDKKGNAIEGLSILERIFQIHCHSVHPIKGIPHRGIAKFYDSIHYILNNSIILIISLLKLAFGRTPDERPDRSTFSNGYLWNDIKKSIIDSIEISGQRTSKRVGYIFLIMVPASCAWLLPAKKNSYLSHILDSEFLIAMHCLIILIILDELIPYLFFILLNSLIKTRKTYIDFLFRKSRL